MVVFLCPNDIPSKKSSDVDAESSCNSQFREDTVVCKFVGSTILDELLVEYFCHHSLVEATINMGSQLREEDQQSKRKYPRAIAKRSLVDSQALLMMTTWNKAQIIGNNRSMIKF
ncbi:hypothetical protein E2542_SST14946 [Spatholobus suberectus]|nr:hypothetical protein E2542_SST14946 [Spatholobus suberectus]